jgi:hypothetical protein
MSEVTRRSFVGGIALSTAAISWGPRLTVPRPAFSGDGPQVTADMDVCTGNVHVLARKRIDNRPFRGYRYVIPEEVYLSVGDLANRERLIAEVMDYALTVVAATPYDALHHRVEGGGYLAVPVTIDEFRSWQKEKKTSA